MNIKNILIREISENDLPQISNIIRKAMMPEVATRDLSDEAIEKSFDESNPQKLLDRINGNFYYVAESLTEGRIVGVIGLRKDDDTNLQNRVSTFDVDPDYQGQGLGKLLFQRVEQKARQLGNTKLIVSSSNFAAPIYAHWGFKRVKEVLHDLGNGNKYYTIWMEKDL